MSSPEQGSVPQNEEKKEPAQETDEAVGLTGSQPPTRRWSISPAIIQQDSKTVPGQLQILEFRAEDKAAQKEEKRESAQGTDEVDGLIGSQPPARRRPISPVITQQDIKTVLDQMQASEYQSSTSQWTISEDSLQRDFQNLEIRLQSKPRQSISGGFRPMLTGSVENQPQSLQPTATGRSRQGNKWPFACSMCDNTYEEEWQVIEHMHTHSSIFICEFCGKRYSVLGSLRLHLMLHLDETDYYCKICYKAFPNKFMLIQHMCKNNSRK